MAYIKSKRKGILLFVFALIFFALVGLVYIEKKEDLLKNTVRKSVLENISFEGKVIKSTTIERYDKQYIILCIKLDSTNTNSIYIFDELCALKIKNGIATIPGGLLKKNLTAKYVRINMNRNLKNTIYYQNGEVREYEIGLGSGGLVEKDMDLCN